MPPMQMVGKSIGNMHTKKIEYTHTHALMHLTPHIVFNNKHYWPYTKYKNI